MNTKPTFVPIELPTDSNQLGNLLAQCQTKTGKTFELLASVIGTALGGVGLWLWFSSEKNPIVTTEQWSYLIGAFVFFGLSLIGWSIVFEKLKTISVFENGLVDSKGDAHRLITWDEVKDIEAGQVEGDPWLFKKLEKLPNLQFSLNTMQGWLHLTAQRYCVGETMRVYLEIMDRNGFDNRTSFYSKVRGLAEKGSGPA